MPVSPPVAAAMARLARSYPVAQARATTAVEAERRGDILLEIVLFPRRGTTAQPAEFRVRVVRRGGRWRVASVRGGPRGCRRGGERDPDPGPTMLWC